MNAAPGDHTVELAKKGFVTKQTKEKMKLGSALFVNGSLRDDQDMRDWTAVSNRKDPGALRAFLRQHPSSRFAEKVRSKVEQLEWDSLKGRDDPGALDPLDAFLKRYPVGQFADAARKKVQQIQTEQMEWRTAANSKDPVALEQFLNKYPTGAYAQQAGTALREATPEQGTAGNPRSLEAL
jgi:outer membrane protein assembly factor BamD (BamD/ComL family)